MPTCIISSSSHDLGSPIGYSTRRIAVLGSSFVNLSFTLDAAALIPGNDDEDEELLARAKAGRAERIQAERALEKNYVTKNDLKSDADAVKVQTAIFKLSKVGGLIESGYLALAAETLQSGSWERDLPVTGSNVSDSKSFIEDLALLKRACLANDIDQAKLAYVTTARSLKIYAKSSSRDENFKLL